MVEVDWGDLSPTHLQRARVQSRVAELAHIDGPTVSLRRRGSGYEARLTTPLPAAPAELRLAGDDLGSVIDRACDLLAIVVRESERFES
jgi:hypothetical protein